MDAGKTFWSRFRSFAALPEMRVFWIFFPLLLVVLAIGVAYLPPLLGWLSAALLLALGATVFFTVSSAAQTNQRTAIERSELKGVLSEMGDALIAYDRNFTVLFFNPAAERLFGVSADRVLGQEIKPQAVEAPETRFLAQAVFPSLAPTLATRSKAGEYPEVSDISFENPPRELRVITSPIADESGRHIGFMKIVRDRTRELSLIKSKDEFIAVASHQLRTPVTELSWALETLVKKQELDEEAKMLIVNASRAAKKVLNTTEDLLNVSRIEQGRFGYEFQSANLVEFLDKVLADVMPSAEQAGLKLYFDRPKEALPAVTIDPKKLAMATANVLDNAIRYNVANGQVTVRVAKADEGPYLTVSVKDTGIGISPEEIGKVFTKFFRAGNAVKFQAEGSGLGLYIAKNVVEAHGGTMWAESELGRGTTFYFTVPTDPSLVPAREAGVDY